MEQNNSHPFGAAFTAVFAFISIVTIKDVQAFVSITAGLVAIAAGLITIYKSLKKK